MGLERGVDGFFWAWAAIPRSSMKGTTTRACGARITTYRDFKIGAGLILE
jgi:hypothetical protein